MGRHDDDPHPAPTITLARRVSGARIPDLRIVQTHYDILGVQPGAGESELESAYHRRAHLLHPDHHTGAPAEVRAEAEKWMRELNASWAVLRSPILRSQYDESLKQTEARTPCPPHTETTRPDRESERQPSTGGPATTAAARPRSRRWAQVATIMMIAATSMTSLLLLLSFALGPG
jgi:curved DNA-binding protein CbpA